MRNLILSIFAIALFSSCGPSLVDLAIDNPTESAVTLMVDSLEVEVPAKEVVWVEMGKGSHNITLPSDSIVTFNFTEKMYMVNPTQSSYLMYEEIYGTPSPMMELGGPISKKKVTYLGMEIEGAYEVVEDVVNRIRWDYGPRESLPEMIEIEQGDRPGVIKLMDPYEFMNLIMQAAASQEGE